MKISLNQMITIICILAVGFVTVAPFLQQETYAGEDLYECDAIEVRSFATNKIIDYDLIPPLVRVNTNHYDYYHNSGSCSAIWEHYLNWPDGHPTNVDKNIIGTRWV